MVIKTISSKGDSCNFCNNKHTQQVFEINSKGLLIRICKNCLSLINDHDISDRLK